MTATNEPYIAYEFGAIERAESAARQAKADPDAVIAGLLRLWRHCWREKTDRISGDHLGQFITGADERLRKALSVHFLELDDGRGDRVRGAEKYLRIRASRSRGGHAAKGNLRRGTEPGKGTNQPETSRESAGDEPEDSPGSGPALSANSEQRAFEQLPPTPLASEGGSKKKPPRTRGSRHDPNDGILRHERPPRTWEPGSVAGHEYLKRLEPLRKHMPTVVADLERLTPVTVDGRLVVETDDAFFEAFARENLLEHLNATGPPVELRLAQPPPL